MNSWTKVNQASAAASNRRLVVYLLREAGPLSRRQLAERSGLQTSSLTYITRDLLEQGVIRICGKLQRSGAGKKQVLLEINPDLGWVVGVGVESDSASLVFFDTKGEVIDRDRTLLREPFRVLPQVLRTRVDSWLARHGQPPGKLLGIGVGVPGIVDPQRGVVLQSTRFQMKNWRLADALEDTFGVPATIDNDSNFAALAEARAGNAEEAGNFLYFLINTREHGDGYDLQSLGSSLFLNGKLYRGAHFSSGEIDALLDNKPRSIINAEQLLAVADRNGKLTTPLKQLADHIVGTLVAMVDLIDPSAVIIGGNLGMNNQRMLAYLEQQLNAKILPVPERAVIVRPSMHMDHGVSMGAAISALEIALLRSEADESDGGAPIPTVAANGKN